MTRNRIVGLTTKRASDLTANPLNWRSHPTAQRQAVSASLSALGWVDAVIENIETGYLIDGHERVWQALEKDEMVPVLQVRLSLDEERLALAVLDPLTSMATTDGTVLNELLAVISCTNETLSAVLDNIAATSGFLSGDDDPFSPPETAPVNDSSTNDRICPECGCNLNAYRPRVRGAPPRTEPHHDQDPSYDDDQASSRTRTPSRSRKRTKQ